MSIEAFPQKETPKDPAEMAREIARREIARNKERRAAEGTVKAIPPAEIPVIDKSVKYTHADHTAPKD